MNLLSRTLLAVLSSLLLVAPWPAAPALAQRLDGIAAVVNDEVVLQSDVEEQLYLFMLRSQVRPDSATVDTLRRQILDQLIDEKVIVLEAERQGLAVDPREVDQQVNQAILEARQRMGSEQAFQEQLQRENLTEAQLRQKYEREVRRQAMAQKLIQKQVPMKQVGAAEAEAFFKANPDKFPLVPPEVRIAVIQIPVEPEASERDAARAKAVAARKRIVGGEKFARVASEVSEDPGSANSGGDLGFFGRGTMDPMFENEAFTLEIGRLSEPVESPFGWHIIEVLERDTLKARSGQDSTDAGGRPVVELHARHILIRTQLDEGDAERAQDLALEVRKRAVAGEDFAALVKQYSKFQGPAGPDGDLGFVSLGSFQPHIRAGLDSVKVGGISDALPNQAGFNIFKVIDRRDARPYKLEEIREDLPQVVAQIQQRDRLEEYVKGLREKSHIEIRGS